MIELSPFWHKKKLRNDNCVAVEFMQSCFVGLHEIVQVSRIKWPVSVYLKAYPSGHRKPRSIIHGFYCRESSSRCVCVSAFFVNYSKINRPYPVTLSRWWNWIPSTVQYISKTTMMGGKGLLSRCLLQYMDRFCHKQFTGKFCFKALKSLEEIFSAKSNMNICLRIKCLV